MPKQKRNLDFRPSACCGIGAQPDRVAATLEPFHPAGIGMPAYGPRR